MKKIIGIAVLMAAMITTAFASPTGSVTYSLFKMPEDNYLDARNYPKVGLEKFFATAGLSSSSYADLGYAAKTTGGLYFGIGYTGAPLDYADIGYTEANSSFNGGANKTFKTYADVQNEIRTDTPYNNIRLLFGVADMGFGVGFSSTYQLFEVKEDAMVNTTPVKSYKTEFGNLSPSFVWAMAKDITPNGLRPGVSLFFTFHVDSTEINEYHALNESWGSNVNTDNYTTIGVGLSSGDYYLKRTEGGFKFSVALAYSLDTTIYGENQFSEVDAVGKKIITEKRNGRFNYYGSDTLITNYTYFFHSISPSLKVIYETERIGIGAQLALPVNIVSRKYTLYHFNNYSGSYFEYKEDREYDSTSVDFYPRLYLGSQFKLVPDRFNINIGATIGLSSAGQSQSETTNIGDPYAVPPVADTTRTSVNPYTQGTSADFSVGATLFFTKNVSLDAYTGVRNTDSFNSFGAFGSSLTTFSGVLLSLKY